jgi:hypothetical protein
MTSWVRRHVDVFVRDVLVASYPIVVPEGLHPISDREFIDAAIDQMKEGGNYDAKEIALARFFVRAVMEHPS